MRFWFTLSSLALTPLAVAGGLMAQGVTPSLDAQQQALRDAKARAAVAQLRSELLRQEASNAVDAADRLVARRAMLSAEIETAAAQIEAANARIAIISRRQRAQRAQLGQESEPVLRLNAALQQMTGRPTALMVAQPGQQIDYIHLRAVMATVQPEIIRRTSALRRQIAIQNELHGQELIALKSLGDARSSLKSRRVALAKLEGDARGKAGDLSANAAIEFEQAIAQGERARDIIENIDTQRLSGEKAAALAALGGPALRAGSAGTSRPPVKHAYLIPAQGDLVFGFNELSSTGYRERGLRLALPPSSSVTAPAAGRITYAGRYRSFGQIVIIEHGGGWTTLVTNMASLNVAKGATVSQGTSLGQTRDDQSEITLELRRNGRTIDIAALVS
ncbi:MAG: peptidoglycan DD-metalloendopeptidase family protein [Sphingorhabdus sp.]